MLLPPVRHRRSATRRPLPLAASLLTASTLLVSGVLVASAPAGTALAAAAARPAPPAVKAVSGKACAPGQGVTVVVDFANMGNDHVRLGCAEGPQPSGFRALRHAGFSFTEGSFDGFLCTINGKPAQGAPFCETNQYWAYSKSDGVHPYEFSTVGGQDRQRIPVGSVEGWRFSLFSETATAPSVAPATVRVARPHLSTYGRHSTVRVRVDSALPVRGAVRVWRGHRLLGQAAVRHGLAAVRLGRTELAAGRHQLKVRYRGSETVTPATRKVSWRVAKAPSRTLVSRAPKPATTDERTVLSVQVKAPVSPVRGRVKVKEHGRVVRHGRLAHGAVLLTLPRLDAGRHTFRVVYTGRPNISRSANVVGFRVQPGR